MRTSQVLIDADVLCYRIGFACEEETPSTACQTMGSFLVDIFSNVAVHAGEILSDYRLFLTGGTNFRNDIAVTAPYKGNRESAKKPSHIDTLRAFLVYDWQATVSQNEEADDVIAYYATAYGPEAVICSVDKDFLQVPCHHYNFVTKRFRTVTEEEGRHWFYQQVLMGDRIDNIIGLKGIGEKKSDKLLADCSTEEEYYNKCVEVYSEHGEEEKRVIENARLLWLRRTPEEIWQPPKER